MHRFNPGATVPNIAVGSREEVAGLERTAAQRLTHAQAAARRWARHVRPLAPTDAPDELFCLVHRNWVAAERHVERLRAETASDPPGNG